MIQLYTVAPSLYCAKIRIVLRRKGLAWNEMAPPGGYGSDRYRALVPAGNLPALVDDDRVISDSEAIAEYLEEVYPDPPMLPRDPRDRALIRNLSRFHDTRLEPEIRALFPYLPGRAEPPPALVAEQGRRVLMRLDDLARLLPSVPTSPAPSLGDCGLAVTFAWIDALTPIFALDIAWPDVVRDYRARIASLPDVAYELAAYRPRIAALLDTSIDAS